MGVAAIGRGCGSGDRAYSDDFPRTLLLHYRGDGVARIDREQIHRRQELQERRIDGACLRIDGPTATAACIRDQHIDQTPCLDDPRYDCLDRRVVPDT